MEFQVLAAESGWNEEALHGVFVNRLSKCMKDELALKVKPDSLDQLISLAFMLDNRIREQRKDRASQPQALFTSSSLLHSSASPTPEPHLHPRIMSPNSKSPWEEPMQLGRTRLTPAERSRPAHASVMLG